MVGALSRPSGSITSGRERNGSITEDGMLGMLSLASDSAADARAELLRRRTAAARPARSGPRLGVPVSVLRAAVAAYRMLSCPRARSR